MSAVHLPFSRLSVRAAAIAVVATFVTAGVSAGGGPPTRADADAMLRKVAVIATNGLGSKPSPRRTDISEAELNAFLAIHVRSEIPAGVVDPEVAIDPAGRLTGRATVDLDEVREARRAAGYSVLSLLSGRVPLEARGVLTAEGGRGQFTLESARAGGVPIPKMVLQQVVSYYSRSTDNPEGFDLDAPFELPAGIREIQTEKGRAVVVQ